MKKIWLLSLVLVLVLSVFALGQEIKNPDTIVHAAYGTVNTLDPAYSYDTASGAVIFNVMENLVSWPYGVVDADETDLSYSLASADLLPMLATVVPSVDNGLVVTYPDGSVTYQFPIRKGVGFHYVAVTGITEERAQELELAGGVHIHLPNCTHIWITEYLLLTDEDKAHLVPGFGELTPEDVEYTFERAILQDRDGGPVWMFIEPLSGQEYWRLYQVVNDVLGIDTNKGETIKDLTPEQQAQVYDAIDSWVEVTPTGDVVFHLDAPYPPFLTILAHGGNWGAILDKEWVIAQGGWDGAADTWAAWYNPGGGQAAEDSELYDVINGTGPYMLDLWDPGIEVVYERFDGYWRGELAPIKTVVNKKIQEWSDRLLLFGRGDADICGVDPQYLPQVMGQPGIVTTLNLPTLSLSPCGFFTSDLNMEGNDLVGSGTWAEDGVPSEFFNDAHLRKAFAYAFEYQTYIDDVYGVAGGYLTHGPVPKAFGWAYDDDPAIYYNFDMEKATEEMKLAHGGKVWDTGFTFTALYNEGNQGRKVAAEIVEKNIESMNPKFHIDVRGVPWASYLDRMVTEQMPLFWIGWLADFPDPHNFVVPFAHSTGTFSGWQGATLIAMFAEKYDPLITAAMATTDQAARAAIYYQIEQMSYEDCYDIWLPQVNGYRTIRDWVQGCAFNPIFPGYYYYYSIYKAYE